MTTPLFQVDAFTNEPFKGNPAAVCVLDKPADENWMQAVAAEMNLSETAFIQPHEDPFKRAWRLRWFTPQTEVDLCGHATLATAHVLFNEGYLKPTDKAQFHTKSGLLTCLYDPSGWITMDFPATPAEEADPPEGLLAALGLNEVFYIGRNRFDCLVEVDSPEVVQALTPNMSMLAQVEARGVIVTSRSDRDKRDKRDNIDFVSRFFGPAVGVPEDPVTGSAHCCLAPYWAGKLGKNHLTGYQASKRGGTVQVTLNGDRVELRGQAVTVWRGTLI